MQVLTYIQVLFNATTTTKYAILDLLLLNADTDVSTAAGQRQRSHHRPFNLTYSIKQSSLT
jgi:hypothetical protein